MDTAKFQARYDGWLEQARPLLEAAQWTPAFRGYPFPRNEDAPWAPLTKPLAESRVAVLSTAGLYVASEQPPFNAADIEGDWTFRELPGDAPLESLAIAHDHFDHARAEQDRNCVYPMDRLREMARDGVIGALAEAHFSISGYCTRPDLLAEHTVPRVVTRIGELGVDALLHIPV